MAPSQRGCRVMIKRSRKGRTGRPKAPGIHINRGLVEAHPGSPWSEALDKADCKQLMNLLEENPCRVVLKRKAGFTVLHAAAMRGCLKLLDQVFDLFKDKDRFVHEEEGIELSLQELLKAEANWRNGEKGRLTAFEFAWWSMGNYKCRYYLLTGERDESKNFLSFQSQIFFRSSIDPVAADKENSSPRHLLLGVLADHRSLLLSETVSSETFEEDMDYNFVADCEELRFHHSLEHLGSLDYCKEYVEAVIGGCVEKGPLVLEYLFQLRNAQGRTPLHVAVEYDTCVDLVGLIPGGVLGRENEKCLNMRDSRGWTALHHASIQIETTTLVALLDDGRADVNAKVKAWSGDECIQATAFHLAVIHNQLEAVEQLLKDPRTNVNALFYRRIFFDDSLCVNRFQSELQKWTALQLAAVAGLPEVVKMLLTCPMVADVGRLKKYEGRDQFKTISAIHLAAASRDLKTLRLLITYHQFDPLVTFHGATSLHFAVASRRPTSLSPSKGNSTYIYDRVMNMEDFGGLSDYMEAKWQDAKIISQEEREACISILVLAGANVWQKDDDGNFPDPGISASGETQLAWQKLVASETLEAKKT